MVNELDCAPSILKIYIWDTSPFNQLILVHCIDDSKVIPVIF